MSPAGHAPEGTARSAGAEGTAGSAGAGDAARRDDYARAGFSARLGWGRSPALLVVDAVRAYTEPGSPLHLATAAAAVDAMADLVAAARAGGRPVVWTSVTYRPGGDEAALFRAKVPALVAFEEGSPLAGWPDRLRPGPTERVVRKHFASAFFGTDLASGLTAAAVDTVVVTGFSTSGCVRASALDALQHGFRPVVVAEAVADRDAGPQEANLFDLDAKYADVVTLADALAHLDAPTAHGCAGGPGRGAPAGVTGEVR